MNKAQKDIELTKLAQERKELNTLKAIYNKAAEDVNNNLVITNGKIEVLLSDIDNLDEETQSIIQSQIYHKDFQEAISRQLNGILNELNSKQYKSIDEYLNTCYETGFIGAVYELADQGIPLIMPIDEKKVVKAINIDSKINKPLYTKLGEDVDVFKRRIANNISRGIAFSDSYENIARNIRNDTNVSFNRAMRIVRTEGHRVHVESSFDAMKEAQSKGADIVKQWNSQLDGKTRPMHRLLDGQIRELDEPFEVKGHKVMYPSAFGIAGQDINCRCVIHQRARWALSEEELKTLQERASFHGLRVDDSKTFGHEKAKSFADFTKNYLIATEETAKGLAITGGSSKIVVHKSLGAAAKKYQVKLADSNEHTKLAEDQTITGKTFAGKGTNKEIRVRYILESRYHIPADEWEKVSGNGYVIVDGKRVLAELHWYEADGEVYEMKVKRYLDEG